MIVILGYQLYDVARSDYGMTIAHASFQLGLLGLVQFIPYLALSPIAGVVADRFDRRKVAGIAGMTNLLIALALGWASHRHAISLPLLFGLAALHGAVRVFISPALSSITPNIVPAEQLPRAIALSAVSWQSGTLAGPTAAGLLYAFGADLPYLGAAALLAISSMTTALVRQHSQMISGRSRHLISL